MRRRYSKEFKPDSISLVTEQGYSRVEAAKSLGIGYELLGRWIREYTKDNEDAFRSRGNWSMSSRMKASLVCDALKMAIWLRKPRQGLIVH